MCYLNIKTRLLICHLKKSRAKTIHADTYVHAYAHILACNNRCSSQRTAKSASVELSMAVTMLSRLDQHKRRITGVLVELLQAQNTHIYKYITYIDLYREIDLRMHNDIRKCIWITLIQIFILYHVVLKCILVESHFIYSYMRSLFYFYLSQYFHEILHIL